MGSTLDRRLEQRAGNGLLDCLKCLVIALGLSDTDVCNTLVLHNCLYICKVQIDQRREIDQVCDTLNCLLQHLICLLQCLRHCRPAVYDLKQLVIRDDDQRVNILLQTLDACQRIIHACTGLEAEWLRHNADSQNAHLLCNPCHDRSCTGTGTSAHTTGNKHHVRTLNRLTDILRALLSCLLTYLRLRACAKSFGDLLSNLNRCRRLAHE